MQDTERYVRKSVSLTSAKRGPGQPRKGIEPRQVVGVRLEPRTIERIKHLVKHHGDRLHVRSMADVIDRALEVWLHSVDGP